MNWYLKVLKQYADFKGRARRTEYWMFALFNMVFAFVMIIIDSALGLNFGEVAYGVFYMLYCLAVLIPGLAVTVRRLHDIGKSGWAIFIAFIPIVGSIWLLVLLLKDSQPEDNQYGECPKKAGEDDVIIKEPNIETLTILIIIWLIVNKFLFAILNSLSREFYATIVWSNVIAPLTGLIWGLIPLGLAFTIKDKSKRTIMLILGGIYLFYCMYSEIV